MDQQRFERIADAGTLAFGVFDDVAGTVEIAVRIDKDMADSFIVLDDGHGRLFDDGADQTFPAARDDEINVLVHFQHQ